MLLTSPGTARPLTASARSSHGSWSSRHGASGVLADRSLVPRIVDESLRIDPPVWNMARTVTTETEMARCQTLLGREGDARLRRGHRDPERFEGPNDFDIDREGRSGRLAFGSGRHGCIGEGPGRLELTRVLEHMLDNFPDLEVDRDAVWGGHISTHGLVALPGRTPRDACRLVEADSEQYDGVGLSEQRVTLRRYGDDIVGR